MTTREIAAYLEGARAAAAVGDPMLELSELELMASRSAGNHLEVAATMRKDAWARWYVRGYFDRLRRDRCPG